MSQKQLLDEKEISKISPNDRSQISEAKFSERASLQHQAGHPREGTDHLGISFDDDEKKDLSQNIGENLEAGIEMAMNRQEWVSALSKLQDCLKITETNPVLAVF